MKLMKHTLVAATAAALSMASMSAMAQPKDGPRGPNPAFASLKLTDAQKAQIKKINESYRSAQRPDHADMEKSWKNFQADRTALLKNKTFDANKARALIQQQQQQREAFELKNLEREHAVFQVLTPAQQEQVIKEQANRKHQPMKHGAKPAPENK